MHEQTERANTTSCPRSALYFMLTVYKEGVVMVNGASGKQKDISILAGCSSIARICISSLSNATTRMLL